MDKARVRIFPESNYKAIYSNGKTFRIAIDPSNEIRKLPYPEFYDVDIFGFGGLCNGGCSYCYLSGHKNGSYVEDAVEKIYQYFEPMSMNERPFQVALPGSGEGYLHPDFIEILEAFHQLGITPNYTTNGMWVDEGDDYVRFLMEKTKYLCGGVAVTCHEHLRVYWEQALIILKKYGVRTNTHFVISDKYSIDFFLYEFSQWKDFFNTAVLLPYGVQGRARKEKDIEWNYLIENLPEETNKISFGANFYSYIKDDNSGKLNLSLYHEKDFSGFLDLSTMKLHESSWVLDK